VRRLRSRQTGTALFCLHFISVSYAPMRWTGCTSREGSHGRGIYSGYILRPLPGSESSVSGPRALYNGWQDRYFVLFPASYGETTFLLPGVSSRRVPDNAPAPAPRTYATASAAACGLPWKMEGSDFFPDKRYI